MEINLFYTILDYQKELRYSAVISELQELHYLDRYTVSSEPDPFFSRLATRHPMISVTTIVDRVTGYIMKMEPLNMNRRNRRRDLHRYITV